MPRVAASDVERYRQIARPFEWTFTRGDLDALLARIDTAQAEWQRDRAHLRLTTRTAQTRLGDQTSWTIKRGPLLGSSPDVPKPWILRVWSL
ncbi:MAG TPA: hypothetical protein VNY27_10125 [Solirubrobacteraceae bacterium]|jgi:hypothetical protein|nr:hypothetical protein [Solirubrobacteraceae bacterium]